MGKNDISKHDAEVPVNRTAHQSFTESSYSHNSSDKIGGREHGDSKNTFTATNAKVRAINMFRSYEMYISINSPNINKQYWYGM